MINYLIRSPVYNGKKNIQSLSKDTKEMLHNIAKKLYLNFFHPKDGIPQIQ